MKEAEHLSELAALVQRYENYVAISPLNDNCLFAINTPLPRRFQAVNFCQN